MKKVIGVYCLISCEGFVIGFICALIFAIIALIVTVWAGNIEDQIYSKNTKAKQTRILLISVGVLFIGSIALWGYISIRT